MRGEERRGACDSGHAQGCCSKEGQYGFDDDINSVLPK